MNDRTNQLIAALLALALVTGGAAVVSAAPGSIDGTQTDTTDEVYISSGKTMDASFNASGGTTWNMTIENVSDGADLAMNVSMDGVDYYAFSGAFGDYNDGDPDADATTSGKYHAFTDDELADVPMTINENVTLNVTYWNASASNPAPTTIQVFVENTDERSVIRITGESQDTDTETDERVLRDDLTHRSIETDDVAVNGGNTTVVYVLAGNTSEEFDSTVDGLESGSWALIQGSADGDVYPVFVEESGDTFELFGSTAWDLSDHGSYYVYDSDAGTLSFVTSSEDFDNGDRVDLEANSEPYGVIGALQDFGAAGAVRLASSTVGL